MVSIVSLQGVVALLGRFPALAGADLEVGEGEIVLVQGPNGAGKSTLLRVCAGLLRIESGRAEVLGHDLVADRAAVRRSVGLLGHDTALYWRVFKTLGLAPTTRQGTLLSSLST